MSISKQFNQAIRVLKQSLDAERSREAVLIAKEGLSLIRLRIQNTGKDQFGKLIQGGYSKAKVPVWFFDKISNKGAQKRLRSKGYFASYSDARKANNLQNKYVDLTFSGAMFKGIGVDLIENKEGISTSIIQGQNTRSEKLIEYNSRRFGAFIRLSEDEQKQLTQANLERVVKQLKKVFRG
jgi:hypothetical protein